MFNGAEGFGLTSRIALASVYLDSIKATFALSVQLRSKFDLGDNLVCPLLAAVSNVLRGINFARLALSVQLRSKFDLGDNLVCPSLAAGSNVLRGRQFRRTMRYKPVVIIDHSQVSMQRPLLLRFHKIQDCINCGR